MRRLFILLLVALSACSFGNIGNLWYAANLAPRLATFPGDITPYIQQASWNAQASSLQPNTGKPFNDTTAVIPIATATNASPGVLTPSTATLPYYDANKLTFAGGTGSWAALNGTIYIKITGQVAPAFAIYSNVALSTPIDTTSFGPINAGCTIQGQPVLDNNSVAWNFSGIAVNNTITDSGQAIQGGPVTSHTVTNGGSGYTSTPTVALPTAASSDTKAIKATNAGAPTAVVTSLAVSAINPLLSGSGGLGMGYLASPTDTITGGGGTLAAAHGNALPAFASQNSALLTGSGWIYQAANGAIQRSTKASIVNASTWKIITFVRGKITPIGSSGLYQPSNYTASVNQAGTVQIIYYDNYNSTSGQGDTPKATVILNHAGSALTFGETVTLDLRAVPVTVGGVASTQLYCKVTGTTSGTIYDDATPGTTQAPTTPRTDSVDGLGSALYQGSCAASGTDSAQVITTYNPLGISCNPTGVTLGVAGQVVAVNGLGTAFTGTPFGMTSGATMTAQSLSSGTVGSITVTAGSTSGTSYVWDSTPADSTSIAVSTVTGNGVPIVITPVSQTALQDGVQFPVSSVGGNTAANGTFYAKVSGQTGSNVALYSDAALTMAVIGNGAYTSGGTMAIPPVTPLTLQATLPPVAVPSLASVGTVTLAASGPATFADFTGSGVSYKLLRSQYANYPASGLPVVQIGATQTTTNSALTPTTIVDTSVVSGPYWYQWQTTDNQGQVAYSVSVVVSIPAATISGAQGIFVEADSVGKGHGATPPDLNVTMDFVVGAGDGNGSGTMYTPGVNAITVGPPQSGGPYAQTTTAAMFVDAGGVVRYAYATGQPGNGYNAEGPGSNSGGILPTLTLPATAGTPATVVPGCGGGWPLFLQRQAWAWGFQNLTITNSSVGGSASGGWLPHGGMGASASNGVITTAFNSSLANNAPVTFHYANADGTTCIINGFAGGTSGPTFTLYLNSGPSNPSTVTSSAGYITSTDGSYTNGNAKYIREAAFASRAAQNPTGKIAIIQLGLNDANGAVTQTKYQLQIGGMIEDDLENGIKTVILENPTYWYGQSNQSINQALGHDYPIALGNLAAAIPGNVIHGGAQNYSTFANLGLPAYSDTGLHLNTGGYGVLAGLIWNDVFPYLAIGIFPGQSGSHIIGG